jgi:putative CocE/NonD family hydrolase
VQQRHGQITVPSLNIGGWWDLFTRGALRNFAGMRAHGGSEDARRGTMLLMGPWEHTGEATARCGDRRLANRAAFLTEPFLRRWFDLWLRDADTGLLDEPPARIFVTGPDQWRTYEAWPPPETVTTPIYLHSGGRANTLSGDGTLSFDDPAPGAPPDRFTYDPSDPVPSLGGIWNLADGIAGGIYDQRPVETREDVLVYTSAPLTEPLTIIGPVSMTLWAATDAPDTDFTAKLVDVTPEGTAWNVCDGIIRARYRTAFTHPTSIQPGEPLEYTIDLRAAANQFGAGHRLRVEVSSSNFPRFDPNLNTGSPLATETASRPARQTVFHDAEHPSRVLLPVQPR